MSAKREKKLTTRALNGIEKFGNKLPDPFFLFFYLLIAESTPLKKVTEPQDVANMVAYLASENASGLTGQNITVDGGLTMN